MTMDHDEFRTIINERVAKLEALLESGAQGAEAVELDQARVGRLSHMNAMQAQAINVETQRRRRLELTRLRAALSRLDDGSFGQCALCEEPIGDKRLQLDPACVTCIQCAREAERR